MCAWARTKLPSPPAPIPPAAPATAPTDLRCLLRPSRTARLLSVLEMARISLALPPARRRPPLLALWCWASLGGLVVLGALMAATVLTAVSVGTSSASPDPDPAPAPASGLASTWGMAGRVAGATVSVEGSQTPEFRTCVASCDADLCGPDGVDDGITGRPEEHPHRLPQMMSWAGWSCSDDCQYHCTNEITNRAEQRVQMVRDEVHSLVMHEQERTAGHGLDGKDEHAFFPYLPFIPVGRHATLEARESSLVAERLATLPAIQKQMVKYYGKWVFVRRYGLQEPLSMAYSLATLLLQIHGLYKFHVHLPDAFPLKREYMLHVLLSMQTSLWAALYHTHNQHWITEKLDLWAALASTLHMIFLTLARLERLSLRPSSDHHSDQGGHLEDPCDPASSARSPHSSSLPLMTASAEHRRTLTLSQKWFKRVRVAFTTVFVLYVVCLTQFDHLDYRSQNLLSNGLMSLVQAGLLLLYMVRPSIFPTGWVSASGTTIKASAQDPAPSMQSARFCPSTSGRLEERPEVLRSPASPSFPNNAPLDLSSVPEDESAPTNLGYNHPSGPSANSHNRTFSTSASIPPPRQLSYSHRRQVSLQNEVETPHTTPPLSAPPDASLPSLPRPSTPRQEVPPMHVSLSISPSRPPRVVSDPDATLRIPLSPQRRRNAGVLVLFLLTLWGLEVWDFPPYLRTLDAHALWHLVTIPATWFWYSCLLEDAQALSLRLERPSSPPCENTIDGNMLSPTSPHCFPPRTHIRDATSVSLDIVEGSAAGPASRRTTEEDVPWVATDSWLGGQTFYPPSTDRRPWWSSDTSWIPAFGVHARRSGATLVWFSQEAGQHIWLACSTVRRMGFGSCLIRCIDAMADCFDILWEKICAARKPSGG